MTLRERLRELDGCKVKIGGAVGFFYCGEVFSGLEKVIDDIGAYEKQRLSKELAKAEFDFKNWEKSYNLRIKEHINSISYFESMIREKEWWVDYYIKVKKNAMYYQNQLGLAFYYQQYFRDVYKKAVEALHDVQMKKQSFKKNLRWNQDGLARLNTPDAKERWQANVHKRLERANDEYEQFSTFSNMEIKEEYMSQAPWDLDVHIIIIKSSITGRYWDEKECKADSRIQIAVARAKRKECVDDLPF